MNAMRKPSIVATILMIGFGIYVLLPIYWLLVNATKSTPDLFSTFGFWFSAENNFWDNVVEVMTKDDGIFGRWMLNTVGYSTAAALGATVLAVLAGYAFAKWRFRGRDSLFWLVLIAIMVPGAALAVPTFQLVAALGLVDSPLAVILPSMVSPFAMYMLTVYISSAVPDEIIDAARVDGAGEARIITQVVTPIIGPGIATVFLLTFVATWNNYLLPLLVLQSPDLMPITLGLTSWNQQSLFPSTGSEVLYSLVVTGSLLSIIPLIVIFIFMQRYLRSGLTLGAVK